MTYEFFTGLVSIVTGMATGLGWLVGANEFHDYIERSVCRSFECAVANGLLAVWTILVAPLFIAITVGEAVHRLLS